MGAGRVVAAGWADHKPIYYSGVVMNVRCNDRAWQGATAGAMNGATMKCCDKACRLDMDVNRWSGSMTECGTATRWVETY